MMRERKWFLIAIVLVVTAGALAYFLFVSEQARQAALEEEASRPIDLQSTLIEERSSGLVPVELYFHSGGRLPDASGFLRVETRELHEVPNPALMARQILIELLKGASGGDAADDLAAETPVDGLVRQVFLLEDGTAVVDFSARVVTRLPGGILSELGFIQSVTRSLRENLSEVERVRFLVDGQERRTLAGHISLARPFM